MSAESRRTAETGAQTAARRKPAYRLLYLVKRTYAAAKILLDDTARAHGTTASDYTLLSFLRRLEPCSSADLARAQKVTPQAATQQVAQLKARGLVVTRASETNRRIALISMTPRGREVLTEMSEAARAIEDEIMADFTAEQRETVQRFMLRMIAIAERKGRIGNDD